jgi:hypothetical protein
LFAKQVISDKSVKSLNPQTRIAENSLLNFQLIKAEVEACFSSKSFPTFERIN